MKKKLKLSYDFSNLLAGPKPKPIKIEISNIKQVHNNNNNISTTSSTFNTKDIHSLYTIIKKIIIVRIKEAKSNRVKRNLIQNQNLLHVIALIIITQTQIRI